MPICLIQLLARISSYAIFPAFLVLGSGCGGGGEADGGLIPSANAATPTPTPTPTPTQVILSANGPLTATRTSGVAPLAVQFEVTGAFSGSYAWDFGDNRGQAWAISGRSKNAETDGSIASHVYDLPGTYTVRVGTESMQITVADPATAYAGTRTVCVSPAARYAGCPAGATQQTSLPSSYAGLRVLLNRGESFGGISPRNTDSGFQVGAYGTGAKPVVAGVNTGMVSGIASWTSDWTVMDLNVGVVNIDATTSRLLLYRNDINRQLGGSAQVNIGTAAGYYQRNNSGAVPSTIYWPREVFLVENDIQGVVNANGTPNLVVMGFFLRSAILGNTINKATEHSLRIWAGSRVVIAHNAVGGDHYVGGGIGIRHAIKIHSGGTQAFTDTVAGSPAPATSRIVIANNQIGSPTYPGSWLVGIGPQNADAGTVEGIEDVLAAGNVFIRGPYTGSDIQWRGRRMTNRGNSVQGGGTPSISRNGSNYDAALSNWDGPYISQ